MKKNFALGVILTLLLWSPATTQARVMVTRPRLAQSYTTLRPKPTPVPVQQWTSTLLAYASTVGQTDASPYTTAAGAMAGDGIVANNCLPFGTKVRFPKLFGAKEFVVQDRMAPRYGCGTFDVWHSSTAAARQFGRQVAVVEIY